MLNFNYLGQQIESSHQNQVVLGSEKHFNDESNVLLVSDFIYYYLLLVFFFAYWSVVNLKFHSSPKNQQF